MESFVHLLSGFSTALTLENLVYCLLGVTAGMLVGILPGLGLHRERPSCSPLLSAWTHICDYYVIGDLLRGDVWRHHYVCSYQYPGRSRIGDYLFGRASFGEAGKGRNRIGSSGNRVIHWGNRVDYRACLSRAGDRPNGIEIWTAGVFCSDGFGLDPSDRSDRQIALNRDDGCCVGANLIHDRDGYHVRCGPVQLRGAPINERFRFCDGGYGLFGLSEILTNAEIHTKAQKAPKVQGLLPRREEWRPTLMSIGRGTGLGFLVGLLPGSNSVIPAIMSYSLEKKTG